MATRAANLRFVENGLLVASVTGLLNGDQSGGMDLGVCQFEKSWQVSGTFGVGGSVQAEKSDDGANWVIAGTALTAAGLAELATAARFVRFNVTAGDGTTSLAVVLVSHPIRG